MNVGFIIWPPTGASLTQQCVPAPSPSRSPRNHCWTTAFDQARQVDGAGEGLPGNPYEYLRLGNRYRRAPSVYLILVGRIPVAAQVAARDLTEPTSITSSKPSIIDWVQPLRLPYAWTLPGMHRVSIHGSGLTAPHPGVHVGMHCSFYHRMNPRMTTGFWLWSDPTFGDDVRVNPPCQSGQQLQEIGFQGTREWKQQWQSQHLPTK